MEHRRIKVHRTDGSVNPADVVDALQIVLPLIRIVRGIEVVIDEHGNVVDAGRDIHGVRFRLQHAQHDPSVAAGMLEFHGP